MPRTTKTRAPLCQSCGKSTRHHSPKYCRPCAESVARFAEQFGEGEDEEQEIRRTLAMSADVLPDHILTLSTALCEIIEASRGEQRKQWVALSRRMVHAGKVWKLCVDIENQLRRTKPATKRSQK